MENDTPKHKSIEAVLSYFQTRPDVGGFVVQKTDDRIEFDAYFSDDFMGTTDAEACSTMITVIAAMRNIADNLAKKMIEYYKIDEKKFREHIADMYYQIQKNNNTGKDEISEQGTKK